MLVSLYYALTLTARPVFQLVLKRRVKNGKEDKNRLNERMGKPQRARPNGSLIWFHGASVGESLSALPLIEKLSQENPDVNIMVTTGTVTSARLMADRLKGNAFHQFIPLDHPHWVKSFLDHWHPDAVIWLESDFWPNMLFQIQKRQIPAVLLNARMGQVSFERWSRYGRSMLTKILKTFDICLTQSTAEKERLDHFGHPDVRVSDNLKYGADKLPVDQDKKRELISALSNRPVWQFASTHPGEEAQSIRVHKKIKAKWPDILTVIIPRHPARGPEIKDFMTAAGLTAVLRSSDDQLKVTTDIYIADTMGEMGVFFDTIDLTAIGGSFVPHGGHNPIEPAQFGNLVLYGPHMFNFKLICSDFESANACIVTADSDDLANHLLKALSDPDYKLPFRDAGLKLTQEKSVALNALWADISPWLDKAFESQKHD